MLVAKSYFVTCQARRNVSHICWIQITCPSRKKLISDVWKLLDDCINRLPVKLRWDQLDAIPVSGISL